MISSQIKNMIKINKNLGETPLQVLDRLRLGGPEYKNLPMTYAGRLDPMAEGELLVLVGEECKNKEKYLSLDKEYEFESVFGFKTDSFDLLGISKTLSFDKRKVLENFEDEIKNSAGKFFQEYPPFSSKTVGGVPLFKKTRDGDVFDLPKKEVEIYEAEFLGFREISGNDLLIEIKRRIGLVRGDFRQDEVIKVWEENFQNREEETFLIARARIKCSSGFYVRAFVNDLPFPATTFSIKRTKFF